MRRLRGLLQLATFAAYGCAGPALPASGTAPTQAPPSARPAAVTGHDATNTHSRSATLNEQLALRRLMRDTEKLRGRRFSQPVELRIEDRVGMRAYAARALDEDDLVRAKRRYVALGLLPADLDLRRLLEELLEDELVG